LLQLRFSLVALLALRFGPKMAETVPAFLRLHGRQILASVVLLGISGLAIKWARKRYFRAPLLLPEEANI
jgi:hypothetical protein